MNQAAELAAEALRLEILQILKEQPTYRLNDNLLKQFLKLKSYNVSQAELGAQLAWLSRTGTIALETLPICTVAILRNEGVDVVEGTAYIPGIARPGPAR